MAAKKMDFWTGGAGPVKARIYNEGKGVRADISGLKIDRPLTKEHLRELRAMFDALLIAAETN